MKLSKNWEKKSTIRTRPRRLLSLDDAKYFFPVSEQPLCLHPLVQALGEDAKRYILVQSAYMFMQNIALNETLVVCDIANKIVQGKAPFPFSEETCQNLLTVIIDESYHAYVANDFSFQVTKITGIKPLGLAKESSLSCALATISRTLSPQFQFLFEIIAVCIAENSITKELVNITKENDVNSFFYEVNADHAADEGRHCVIFTELLTQLWREIPEAAKEEIGPILPSFIYEYLKRDITIANDRRVLSQLNLAPTQIDTILEDTHPPYSQENFSLVNPIVANIISLLRKSGVLNHPQTIDAFKKFNLIKEYKTGALNFLWCLEANAAIFEIESQTITFTSEVNACCALLLSYILDVTQNDHINFFLKTQSFQKIATVNTKRNTVDDFVQQFENSILLHQTSDARLEGDETSLYIEIGAQNSFAEKYSQYLQIHIEPQRLDVYYNRVRYNPKRITEFLKNFSFYLSSALENRYTSRHSLPLVCPKQMIKLLPPSFDNEKTTLLALYRELSFKNPKK